MTATASGQAVFQVLDALDHPHGGRILRLRLQEGDPPSVRRLKEARLRAVSPDGEERVVKADGFAAFGGKPSDERLARTGRADLHVHPIHGKTDPPIRFGWTISGPLD